MNLESKETWGRMRHKAKSQELRAKSQELRAKSKELRANSQQHKKRVPRQVSYLSEDSPMGKAVTYSPDFTQYHRRYWA